MGNIDPDGSRDRYFSERARLEAAQGNPIHEDVTLNARRRLLREITAKAFRRPAGDTGWVPFIDWICSDFDRVLGTHDAHLGGVRHHTAVTLESHARAWSRDQFLTALEIAANRLYQHRGYESDIEELQSILADDFSAFRFRFIGKNAKPPYQIHRIDNQHLHAVIVDRSFELMRDPDFAAAQSDYAEAWKHFSAGDLDDAIVNAHKAFESAAKKVIKLVDPASAPEQMVASALVQELKRLDIIPVRIVHGAEHLVQIFTSAGGLRNNPGTGHGALDVTTPEASVALFALRQSGSLVAFLAERWQQLKPS